MAWNEKWTWIPVNKKRLQSEETMVQKGWFKKCWCYVVGKVNREVVSDSRAVDGIL